MKSQSDLKINQPPLVVAKLFVTVLRTFSKHGHVSEESVSLEIIKVCQKLF